MDLPLEGKLYFKQGFRGPLRPARQRTKDSWGLCALKHVVAIFVALGVLLRVHY